MWLVGGVFGCGAPAPSTEVVLTSAPTQLDGDYALLGSNFGETTLVGDVDGDGLQDIVVSAPGSATLFGAAFVIPGPARGAPNLSAAAAVTGYSDGGVPTSVGASLAVGDLNADGVADIAVSGSGGVWLVYGPIVDTTPVSVVADHIVGEPPWFGDTMAIVPDLYGDGGPDLAAQLGDRLYTFAGPIELASSVDQSVSELHVEITGVTGADLEGDGTGDLVVATYGSLAVFDDPTPGVLALQDAAALFDDPNPYAFSWVELAIGDIDGDGVQDLVAGVPDAEGGGFVAVLTRPRGQRRVDRAASARLVGGALDGVGEGVAAGDADGDGATDLLVGAPCAGEGYGAAYLQFGEISGVTTVGLEGVSFPGFYGAELWRVGREVAMGDLDRDGVDDVLIAVPGEPGMVFGFNGGAW